MALSYWQGYGNGTQDTYAVPFPYIYKSHVSVLVNKVSAQFTWLSDQTIKIFPTPENGALVDIRRSSSPEQRLVIYQDGAVLTEAELNLENLQNFYLVQEALDALPQYLAGETDGQPSGHLQTIVDQMVQDVLNSALLADLQSDIGQINLLAESFLEDADRAEDSINDRRVLRKQVGTALANIAEEQLIRVTETSALAARLNTVEASLGNITGGGASSAEVIAEAVARANADAALGARIDAVEADFTNLETTTAANVTTESVARAAADSALSTQITTLTSSLNTKEAALQASIASEASARTTADNAISSTVSTLSTTVGNNSAAISTQATTINGLSAQYTVKINNNGYASGFGLASTPTNGVPTSSFVILADKFSVVTPTAAVGEVPKVPFVVGTVNGISQVGIQGSLLVDGSIFANAIAANTITANKMSVTTLSSLTADLGQITTGDITIGSPTGQRIEIGDKDSFRIWAGTGTKNTTNAKFYIDSSGNAVFGGNLNAAGGTFSGNLSAAGGTFSGSLAAANGTFSGTLTASAINAVNTLNIAGQAISVPIGVSSAAEIVISNPSTLANPEYTATDVEVLRVVLPAQTVSYKAMIQFGFGYELPPGAKLNQLAQTSSRFAIMGAKLVSNLGTHYTGSPVVYRGDGRKGVIGAVVSRSRGDVTQAGTFSAGTVITVPSGTPVTLRILVTATMFAKCAVSNRFLTATILKR